MDSGISAERIHEIALLAQVRTGSGGASQVIFSADGSRLLVAKLCGGLTVFETRTWKRQYDLETNGRVVSLCSSEAGDWFAFGLDHGEIQLRKSDGTLVQSLQASDAPVSALSLASDDSRLICGSAHHVRVYCIPEGTVVYSLERRLGDIWEFAGLAGDTVAILAGRRNGSLLRYTLRDRRLALVWRCAARDVTCVRVSRNLQQVAAGNASGQVFVIDFSTGTVLGIIEGHREAVSCLAFSPDGTLLVSGGFDQALKVWGISDRGMSSTLDIHDDSVMDLALSPDGVLLVSATQSGEIRGWGIPFRDRLIRMWTGHEDAVNDLAFSPDGRFLLSGSDDGSACIWDPMSGTFALALRGHEDSVTAVVWSPDHCRVATGSRDGSARLWQASDGKLLGTIGGLSAPVRCLAFSPDGSLLALGLDNGDAQLSCVSDLRRVCTMSGLSRWVDSLAFSPDGAWLACGSEDGAIRVFSVPQCSLVRTIRSKSAPTGGVNRIVFSPSGDLLFCGSTNGSIRVFRVSDGTEIARFEGHEGPVTGLAISPDGHTLVSSSWDHSVRTWRLREGVEADRFFVGLKQRVNAIACSPVAPIVACGNWDGTLCLFQISDEPIRDAPVASRRSGEAIMVHQTHSCQAPSLVSTESVGAASQTSRVREVESMLRNASTRAEILVALRAALEDGEDLSRYHRKLAELLNRDDASAWARSIVALFRRSVERGVDISRAVPDLVAAMQTISYRGEEPADLVDASDLASADPTADVAAVLTLHFLNQQDLDSLESLLCNPDPSVSGTCRELIRKAVIGTSENPNPLGDLLRQHPDPSGASPFQ